MNLSGTDRQNSIYEDDKLTIHQIRFTNCLFFLLLLYHKLLRNIFDAKLCKYLRPGMKKVCAPLLLYYKYSCIKLFNLSLAACLCASKL